MRFRLLIAITIILAISVMMAYSADFVFVDLKPSANSKIIKTNWWTGLAGNSDFDELFAIAKDGHEFEGLPEGNVPFKIEDAVLTVYGGNSAAMPKKIEGIKIGAVAKVLYFLHMTAWENVGAPSYKFAMHYDDGSSEELLMESNVNSDNWDQVPAPLQDKNSAWVWKEPAVTVANGGLIATRWDNPKSARRIQTIDFISLETVAVPSLFALTLGDASAAVLPNAKLVSTWSHIKSAR